MSSDYALFIILLANDFENETSSLPTISQTIKPSISTRSIDATSISLPSGQSCLFINENNHDQLATRSLCVALKNYLSDKKSIEAVWIISEDKKTYEVTFSVEFGLVSDRTLQDLTKLGIGRRQDTKIFVLPTTIIFEGRINDTHESLSALTEVEDLPTNDILSCNTIENDLNSNDLTLTRKIRKRIAESNFKKSVRARLMVHQVVASIRAATALSFDFVLLICLASMLAAFGLLENSTVVIVASMLVSPLMSPILGIVFGLSVREHSLWRRGLKNELIGLLICTSCGFIIGLFTTFSETKWGGLSSFPTPEMKSRGDIKRFWVGVLIALPSGAGVALSVLGGNTGSLVGVAISASLLPPAVNCGLLFAYSLLGTSFSSIAATSPNNPNDTYHSHLNCNKYINNDYEPLYTCNLANESAILACCSLLLTIVNIICIIIMALIILRIKEVVPLHQPNQDITNFFHHDVKVARDYNRTLHENDFESNRLAVLSINRSQLAQSIVNRWKTFKSTTNSHDNQQHQEIGQSPSSTSETPSTDSESHRKLLHLKTFAKEYDLDVFDKIDYDLLNSESREKVRLLISDLVDMCQEVPQVFIGLYHLQPGHAQTSTEKEHMTFYDEIIEILPPKWYQLFVREQERRQLMSWSKTLNRTYSLHAPRLNQQRSSVSDSNENDGHASLHKQFKKNKKLRFQRQCSFPETSVHSSSISQDTAEVPIEGTRFRIARPSTTTETFEQHDSVKN